MYQFYDQLAVGLLQSLHTLLVQTLVKIMLIVYVYLDLLISRCSGLLHGLASDLCRLVLMFLLKLGFKVILRIIVEGGSGCSYH